MQKYQYTSIDTILAKYHRDFRGLSILETDAIEWIGEALDGIKTATASSEGIAFLEVENYQAPLPNGLHYIVQIAKHAKWTKRNPDCCTTQVIVEELTTGCTSCGGDNNLVPVDCHGKLLGDLDVAYYRPYFDLQYEYTAWANSNYNKNKWIPVRLSNDTFFNTLVCKTDDTEGLYHSDRLEYTIVDDQIRFNFKEGFIAVAYLKQKTDPATGYPMIPDDISAKSAITYYIAWKIKEREAFSHREGALQLAQIAEQHWLKYAKQFKNKAKMPSTVDDYQDLMDQGNYLIPSRNRYYGFFGKLNTPENRNFNDPDRRNRRYY